MEPASDGTAGSSPLLIVVSELDPVARAVSAHWGTPESTGDHVDGVPIRALRPDVLVLRRPGLHIHDEELDRRLPSGLTVRHPTLVFPSIHRSERSVPCLTVHPLGNVGPEAEIGGRPRTLAPTDPLRMADALRRLGESGVRIGWSATYEATHHGPALGVPAMFVEIGFGELAEPPSEAVRSLAQVIPELSSDPKDRVALAIGGGHYAPHFTDLAVKRRWAFGHLLSRHALSELDAETARSAFEQTPGAEGWVSARAEDAGHVALRGVGMRLRDNEASRRGESAPTTGASGT